MFTEIWENLKSVFVPVMILFLVGALAGTWLVSGVIPAMVYYGLQVLSPDNISYLLLLLFVLLYRLQQEVLGPPLQLLVLL